MNERMARKLKNYLDQMEKTYSEYEKTQDETKKAELVKLGREYFEFISKEMPDDFIFYGVLGILQGKGYAEHLISLGKGKNLTYIE